MLELTLVVLTISAVILLGGGFLWLMVHLTFGNPRILRDRLRHTGAFAPAGAQAFSHGE